jgi:hypothetical protein
MIEISCRCGASKKRFNINIGPFYIAECCEEAGYDHLGNRKDVAPESLGLTEQDAAEVQTAKLIEDPDELAALEKLEVVKETEYTADFDGNVLSEKEVTPTKQKRRYNRGGNVKKNEQPS